LNIWNPNIHGNRVDHNFADTTIQRNDGTDNIIEPVNLLRSERWPELATNIEQSAGIEPAFAAVRAVPTERDVIVESTGVDFQTLTGTWTVTKSARGSFSANCTQSSDAKATARWMPILPCTGNYEVSVWRTANAAPAIFTVHHASGRTIVPVSRTVAGNGWGSLGIFQCNAGYGSEVVIAATNEAQGKPVIADVLRLRKVK